MDDLERILGYRDAADPALTPDTEPRVIGNELLAIPFWTPTFCQSLIRAAEAVGAFEPQPDDPVPGHEVSLAVISPRLYAAVEQDLGERLWPVLQQEWPYIEYFGLRDAFGHAQLGGAGETIAKLIRENLGHKYHQALPDYLQRSARHIASKTDVEQAYAVGKAAVELAIKGRNAVMPVIVRKSNQPYKWTIEAADLKDIAAYIANPAAGTPTAMAKSATSSQPGSLHIQCERPEKHCRSVREAARR